MEAEFLLKMFVAMSLDYIKKNKIYFPIIVADILSFVFFSFDRLMRELCHLNSVYKSNIYDISIMVSIYK